MTAMIADENRIKEESLVATSAEILMYQLVNEATQTEIFEDDERERKIQELNLKIGKLTKELKQLKLKHENGKFNIEIFQDSQADIAFYTGFHYYETLMSSYCIVEVSAKNINYGTY